MRTIEIGVRFSTEQAPSFFGIDEVNQLISCGAVVLRFEPADLLMQKTAEGEETVTMYVSGFATKVVLDDSNCSE
jgi:hypothetical protein